MTIAWAVLLDERDVTFDAKVTTTSDIDATIAPPIAWRGLQYIGAGTVPMAGGLVVGGVFGNASRHFTEPCVPILIVAYRSEPYIPITPNWQGESSHSRA